ncbi:MAG: hypothetical protein F4092_13660 [Rhodospirillaceae bacterium]|nr:hypothetical protein [Rhodospirillaceae bacterium]
MFWKENSIRPSARPRAANMGREGRESDSELAQQAGANPPNCGPRFRPAVSPTRHFDRSGAAAKRRNLSRAVLWLSHRAGKISPLKQELMRGNIIEFVIS